MERFFLSLKKERAWRRDYANQSRPYVTSLSTSSGFTTTNGCNRSWDTCHQRFTSGRWCRNYLSRCPELVDRHTDRRLNLMYLAPSPKKLLPCTVTFTRSLHKHYRNPRLECETVKSVDRRCYAIASLPLRLALAASVIGVCNPASSCDFDTLKDYRVTAKNLSQTLLLIGRISGCTISFKPENTRGYNSQPVNGMFSAREAMNRALMGTNLEILQTRNGTLTVRERAIYSDAEQ